MERIWVEDIINLESLENLEKRNLEKQNLEDVVKYSFIFL